MDRSPHRLSEGEKKRVSIASILVMQPEVLVLDEPTVGQDARFKEVLARLLLEVNRAGMTTVVVTHDLDFAAATAARWIVLQRGRVAADGPASRVRADSELVRAGALPPSVATEANR
jgi:energy-coupling factor transport system ATP-binding protein